MQTAQINFKVKPKVKQEAGKLASQLGLSLSSVLNAYLHHFINTKSVYFSAKKEEELEPSEYLKDAIREAEECRERGEVYSFDNEKDALAFIDNLIEEKKEV